MKSTLKTIFIDQFVPRIPALGARAILYWLIAYRFPVTLMTIIIYGMPPTVLTPLISLSIIIPMVLLALYLFINRATSSYSVIGCAIVLFSFLSGVAEPLKSMPLPPL